MFSSTVQFSKIHTFFDFFFEVIEMHYIISFFVCQALFFIFFIILCFCDLFAVTVYYYTLFFLFVKCFFILFLFFYPLHTQPESSSFPFCCLLSDRNVVYHITAFFILQAFFSFFINFFYISHFLLILRHFLYHYASILLFYFMEI